MWKLEAINNIEYYEDGVGFSLDLDFPYLHTHDDYWEFQYVYSPIRHNINNQTLIIKNHSIMVVKPSDCHSVSAREFVENKGKADTMLNLKITSRELQSLLNNCFPNCVKKMDDFLFSPLDLNDGEISFCEKWLKILLENPERRAKIVSIKAFITFIFLKYAGEMLDREKSYMNMPEDVVRLKNKLTSPEYFSRNISEIVSEFGYSRVQAGRLFKKYYNQTMYDYVTETKLAYARRALAFSEEPIIDVADEVGYSLSQFYRIFKERYAISPNEYRIQARHDMKQKARYKL